MIPFFPERLAGCPALTAYLASWSPPFIWGFAILVASGDLGSSQNTRVILQWLLSLVPLLLEHVDAVHGALRKLGHMAAYGVLFFLWFRAFYLHRLRRPVKLLLALTFTLLVALIDEGHQAMVGSRHGCLADIGWDLAGAGFAGFVILAFRKPKPLPGKI